MPVLDVFCNFKSPSFEWYLSLRKIVRSYVWGVWRLLKLFNAVVHQTIANEFNCIGRNIVVMDFQDLRLWPLVLNNVLKELGEQSGIFFIGSLSVGSILMIIMPYNSKKTINMIFTLLHECRAFFIYRNWRFLLRLCQGHNRRFISHSHDILYKFMISIAHSSSHTPANSFLSGHK